MKLPATCLITLTLTGAAMLGCQSGDSASYSSIKHNPSPAMMTLNERDVDADMHVNNAADFNGRMLWDDLGSTFYLDHPSRLSPYPIIYTSGQPR